MATYKKIMKSRKKQQWWMNSHPSDSPSEIERKKLPQGNGNWPGFDHVWANLQSAAHKMANSRYMYLSDDHIHTMAVMGCGHEETMKYWQLWCREYGWI